MYVYPNYWQYQNYVTCRACGGNGINNGGTCWSCNGTGWQPVRFNPPPFMPWPRPNPILPPGKKWVPQCTCGTGYPPNSVCPIHPNKNV